MSGTTKKIDRAILAFFGSLKLSITLLIGFAVVFAISTIIYSGKGQEELLAGFYKSRWFALLSAVLCLNIVVCTFTTFSLKLKKIGPMITHAGFIVMMLGALVGSLTGVNGFITLSEGEGKDGFIDKNRGGRIELPFFLYLDDFILEKVKEPVKTLVLFSHFDEKESSVDVSPGITVKLKGLRATVLEDHPFTKLVKSVSETDQPTDPDKVALWLVAHGGGAIDSTLLIFPDIVKQPLLGNSLFASLETCGSLREALAGPGPASPRLGLLADGAESPVFVPFDRDAVIYWPGTEYSTKILRFFADFKLMDGNEIISASDEPNNPAVEIELIREGHEPETRWLFAKFPDFMDTHGEGGGVKLFFEYPAEAPGDAETTGSKGVRILLTDRDSVYAAWTEEGIQKTILLDGGGDAIFLGNSGIGLEVRKVARSLEVFDVRIPAENNNGEPALLVDLSRNEGTVHDTLWIAAGEALQTGGTGYGLFYGYNLPVKDFKSRLFIYERNGLAKAVSVESSAFPVFDGFAFSDSLTIEVNKPLVREGFYFYQASYDPENESWTGLQVKKNPGGGLLLAGFLILLAGVIFTFYVRPVIDKAVLSKRTVTGVYSK